MTKVLVVDDEKTLLATLKYNLEHEGFEVELAMDGDAAIAQARSTRPDLIVLDLMLPGRSGLDVCRILRAEMTTPIIMLTAKAEEVDKVVGLEVGADDYLTKPFSMRELMARVRSLLRRATMPVEEKESLASGDLVIDLRRREVRRESRVLNLKPKEYDLLVFLARNRGRALTRDQILSDVWGYDFLGDSRTVDVHVRWLREKIEDEPGKPVRLLTVRGAGYRFDG
jgi:DNA-binding response OmpR family regulator